MVHAGGIHIIRAAAHSLADRVMAKMVSLQSNCDFEFMVYACKGEGEYCGWPLEIYATSKYGTHKPTF